MFDILVISIAIVSAIIIVKIARKQYLETRRLIEEIKSDTTKKEGKNVKI